MQHSKIRFRPNVTEQNLFHDIPLHYTMRKHTEPYQQLNLAFPTALVLKLQAIANERDTRVPQLVRSWLTKIVQADDQTQRKILSLMNGGK